MEILSEVRTPRQSSLTAMAVDDADFLLKNRFVMQGGLKK